MRAFRKGREPRGLIEYRRQQLPQPTYDDWSQATGKGEAQEQLCRDQSYLCAYCMGRIEPDGDVMTIEHYCSQSHFPLQQLDWQNMLGVCHGRHGDIEHCDSSRSVEQRRQLPYGELRVFDPRRDARHAQDLVSYDGMGAMRLNDANPYVTDRRADVEYDLFTMLNLDCGPLRDRRRGVLETIRSQVRTLEGLGRHLSAAHHQHLVDYWSEVGADGRHRPYFMVALDWLKKHPPRR